VLQGKMVNPLFAPCGVAQVAVISLACSMSKPLSSGPLRMSWSVDYARCGTGIGISPWILLAVLDG